MRCCYRKYLIMPGVLALAALFCALGSVFAGDIAILGDSQHYDDIQRRLVEQIAGWKPSAVFRTGDQVENGLDPLMWARFEKINEPLRRSTDYFPCLGNHELESPLYFLHFPSLRNRHWYSVDRERVHVIVLDSNTRLDRSSKQYKWLVADLKSIPADSVLTMVIFHHPFFDVSERHGEDEKHLAPVLLPLFEQYGVALVVNGHEHNYQHFKYNGIHLVTTGGGGSILCAQNRESPYLLKFAQVFHYCLVSPQANGEVRVRAIGLDASLIDEFVVQGKK